MPRFRLSKAYQRALNNVSRDERPSLWAVVITDIGLANAQTVKLQKTAGRSARGISHHLCSL